MRCPRLWNHTDDNLLLRFPGGDVAVLEPGEVAELRARDVEAASQLIIGLGAEVLLKGPRRGVDAREPEPGEGAPAWPGPDRLAVQNLSRGVLCLPLEPAGATHRLRPEESLTLAPWFPEAEWVPVFERFVRPDGVLAWAVHLEGHAAFGGFEQDGVWLDSLPPLALPAA